MLINCLESTVVPVPVFKTSAIKNNGVYRYGRTIHWRESNILLTSGATVSVHSKLVCRENRVYIRLKRFQELVLQFSRSKSCCKVFKRVETFSHCTSLNAGHSIVLDDLQKVRARIDCKQSQLYKTKEISQQQSHKSLKVKTLILIWHQNKLSSYVKK